MNMLVRIAMLLGLACAAACGVATGQGANGIDAADPYVGKVSAQVFAPEGSRDKEFGTAGARFVPLGGGRSRLEVQANIRRTNDSGFVIEGSRNAAGWRGRSGGLEIAIDRDGRISGGGIANQHRITFGGRATPERMDLTVETEKLAQAAAGDTMPAGTRIVFDYDLGRDARASANTGAAMPTASPPGKKTQKTCKRRVWKMRNVTTPLGGMTMTQVPVCVD